MTNSHISFRNMKRGDVEPAWKHWDMYTEWISNESRNMKGRR